jgi:hypothetical protein
VRAILAEDAKEEGNEDALEEVQKKSNEDTGDGKEG